MISHGTGSVTQAKIMVLSLLNDIIIFFNHIGILMANDKNDVDWRDGDDIDGDIDDYDAVSYTHLTLPTICSV